MHAWGCVLMHACSAGGAGWLSCSPQEKAARHTAGALLNLIWIQSKYGARSVARFEPGESVLSGCAYACPVSQWILCLLDRG